MTATRIKQLAVALGGTAAMSFAGAAGAVTNFVVNGSFEDGLNGWTIGGTEVQGYPPVAIDYNSASAYPTGAFGEAVPPNNAFTNSPDPVGDHAAYFVSDLATQLSLSQTVFLNPGVYQIGFSAYAPRNGYGNANDATFQGIVASVQLANYWVSAGPPTSWQTFAGATNIDTADNYVVKFVFSSFGIPAKDIVIDQVYIIDGNPPTSVPEPSTYALMLAGLAALGFIARRRMS